MFDIDQIGGIIPILFELLGWYDSSWGDTVFWYVLIYTFSNTNIWIADNG